MLLYEDYRPEPFVDTDGLTREEWLEYRKHGIGASDLPVLMEASEYKSVLALFEEKVSRKPLEELHQEVQLRLKTDQENVPAKTILCEGKFGDPIIDPNAYFNLTTEVGHALELVIAKYLSVATGFPVYRDTILYRHPAYPFLLVDLDFFMVAADPHTGEMRLIVIECKTASYWKKDDWADGIPYAYEMQCRQAMCVLNVNEALIICLFDNNENGIATYRIVRDYGIEANLILVAKSFWVGNVEKKILPFPTIPTKAAKRELAAYAKQQEKHKPLPHLFEKGLAELANEYESLKAEADIRKEAYDAAKEALDAVELQLSTFMLRHDEARCGDLKLRWTQRRTRSMDYGSFKLAYPCLYARFVQENTSLGFEVKQMNTGKNKKEAA